MTAEFNLSDKIIPSLNGHTGFYEYFYLEEDVKEFIRLLKEEIGCEDELHSDDVFKFIDALAGDKLK